MKCEVCGERDSIGVASTSIPMSVAYCRECAEAGVDPYSVLVINTIMINGLENAAPWWLDQVDRSLGWLNKSRDQFILDVKKGIEDMDRDLEAMASNEV